MTLGSPGVSVGFVEEIDFNELKFGQVVGRGAFGVVLRATWRGIEVAVKQIEAETEKRAFVTELKQLSRVCHENIVKLYGASTKSPVCLVMEYADCGSLYNVLHGSPPPIEYTPAHAMSWCLQTAKGVSYLHSMKPKALVHRDLKPPNLLLVQRGTLVKICDFGTACDVQTHMTNNRGSAAWMAPEVFEGNVYSEKCDVFSWGIVLWECLSRQKPFEEVGGPSFRIMWAIHSGTRPPLLKDMPKPLEKLMTRCWSKNPADRPCMLEVVRIMSVTMPFFEGADKPLMFPDKDNDHSFFIEEPDEDEKSDSDTQQTQREREMVRQRETEFIQSINQPEPKVDWWTTKQVQPLFKPEGGDNPYNFPSYTASNRTNNQKRYSADVDQLLPAMANLEFESPPAPPPSQKRIGHRRVGSHGNPPIYVDMAATTQGPRSMVSSASHPGEYFDRLLPITDNPGLAHSHSWAQETSNKIYRAVSAESTPPLFPELEDSLKPLPPLPNNNESTLIYYDHVKLAEQYINMSKEVQAKKARIEELRKVLEQEKAEKLRNERMIEDFQRLAEENEGLKKWHFDLNQQMRQLPR